VDTALDRAVGSVLATLDYDVGRSEGMAREVRQVRASTLRMIVVLDAAATAIALFAVVVAFRATRRHDELLHAHNALLATRVTELDRFAGRVSHDVLSPLNTIASGLALLSSTRDPRDQAYIDRTQRALQRVKQLVDGLLTFARSGAPADASARCSVDAVLANIAADCSQPAAEKGIDLVVEAAERMDVCCSVGVLTSIVQNLVQNAIKYMDARPVRRVVVRARVVGGTARVEVEDSGPGIAAGLQARIFEPFVRGSGEEVSGTGLGLATVKRLAESHGGVVGVRSAAGAGSLFWVEVPLAAAGEATPPVTAEGV
jgi:signal transduction histidine kinase